MGKYNFHLNSDKSVEGIYNDETNKVILSSTHQNQRNVSNLIGNLNEILSVEQNKNLVNISLNGTPFVRVNTKKRSIENVNELTSFETRIFARAEKPSALPFERLENTPIQLKTDLHTHFAGALSPEQLIDCGLSHNVVFPQWLCNKLKLDVEHLKPNDKGEFTLEELVSSKKNYDLLVSSMKIDTSEQETFNKMEDIYTARGPFTKNPEMFIPILNAIAEDSKRCGVKYLELSLSSIISNTEQIKLLEENLPKIEKSTGVTIRFLGALWRHSDKEWNDDEVERLKISSRSPYIVGCDFMGHETNPTSDFYQNIKTLAKHAIINDPSFVIRVHAGENALFKTNVRQVLLAVEEAHYELTQSLGKKLPYPQVRLGHGIYGFNEPPSWDENERTREISTLQLCKEISPIVEFNMSSNLSLNNINNLSEIPIKKYLDNGVRVVLGTDGKGIYSTDIRQEMILAHQAGLTQKDFLRISSIEKDVISKAAKRFSRLHRSHEGKSSYISEKFNTLTPTYTKEVEKKYQSELDNRQKRLFDMISKCGAITDLEQIKKDISGKKPILLTGSSHKHFPEIQKHPEQLRNIRIALNTLVHLIDPDKAYLVTGGTNHGIERELHIIANKYNSDNDKKIIILGTLTEEAAKNSNSPDEKIRNSNKIEINTITHAITPTIDGKIAKRWFDLPDTVLSMVQEQNGEMVAIGGGAIVGDMIVRAHNMGINMNIMSDVVGASGEKAEVLSGYGYEFNNAKELVTHLMAKNPDLIRSVSEAEIDEQIKQATIEVDKTSKEENAQSEKNNIANLKIEKDKSL